MLAAAVKHGRYLTYNRIIETVLSCIYRGVEFSFSDINLYINSMIDSSSSLCFNRKIMQKVLLFSLDTQASATVQS